MNVQSSININSFNQMSPENKLFCQKISNEILAQYFSFILGKNLRKKLKFKDWKDFCKTWKNLKLDEFMNDGGKYRYRRYSVFHFLSDLKILFEKPGEPHYQSKHYNQLNGGIKRYFPSLEEQTKCSNIFFSIISLCLQILDNIQPQRSWHIEVHQFRIITTACIAGFPTPEGIHRDGVDYSFIMLVEKENIIGGESHIYDLQKKPILSYKLENSLDFTLLDDRKLMHSVSPIQPILREREGFRDTLVITFTEL